jgi:hypothetical protein
VAFADDLDLLAASLRADAGDIGAFVEGLASKLTDILPGRVTVKRARRGLLGPKLVQKISVQAGDQQLELLRGNDDSVQTRRARVSGGIVLKTEETELDQWLELLSGALAAEAQHSERTRAALQRLLTGGGA